MIAENELQEGRFCDEVQNSKTISTANSRRDLAEEDQYEVILRSKIDLGVTFSILHQENQQREQGPGPSGSSSFSSGLGSVASALSVSPLDKRALLSEDAPYSIRSETNGADQIGGHGLSNPHIRRSHSTDDIGSYNVANAWIVDKPMVKRCPVQMANEYRSIQVGDVLEAIDGLSTGMFPLTRARADSSIMLINTFF